jgi:Zn-dependent protease with chaperone function
MLPAGELPHRIQYIIMPIEHTTYNLAVSAQQIRSRSLRSAAAHLCAAAAFLAVCAPAWARYTPPPPCANKFSQELERTEGAKVAASVFQQMPVLPESDPVSQYVAQLGARIAQHAPGYRWPFSYHVVASSDINAFALPGGAIFVNLGSIQAAETEAQLAGVLAHETSHVVLRHSTCNISKQQNKDIAYGIGGLLSQILLGNGAAGKVALAGLNGMRGLGYLRMGREDEMQADLLGTDILYDTGYDPRGLPQFFETIQAKYGNGGAQFLSDHPNPGNRTQYVNAEIASLPRHPNPIVTSDAFNKAHAAAATAKTFNAQQIKDGAWKGGRYIAAAGGAAAPVSSPTAGAGGAPAARLSAQQVGVSSGMQAYRGSDYSLSVPSGWQANAESNGGVTLSPPGGSGSFGIAYGTVIGKATSGARTGTDAASLSNAALAIAQQLSQQNGGLQQIGQPSSITIGGQPGIALELRGQSPVAESGQALPEREWLFTVSRLDGDVQYLVFVCPERDFDTLRPLYAQIIQTRRFR